MLQFNGKVLRLISMKDLKYHDIFKHGIYKKNAYQVVGVDDDTLHFEDSKGNHFSTKPKAQMVYLVIE